MGSCQVNHNGSFLIWVCQASRRRQLLLKPEKLLACIGGRPRIPRGEELAWAQESNESSNIVLLAAVALPFSH